MKNIPSCYMHSTIAAALAVSNLLQEPPPPSPVQRHLLRAEDAALAAISATFDVLRTLSHPNASTYVQVELLDEARALTQRAYRLYSAIRIAGESSPE